MSGNHKLNMLLSLDCYKQTLKAPKKEIRLRGTNIQKEKAEKGRKLVKNKAALLVLIKLSYVLVKV